jgi:Mlc titration factor MtfA (ptsG expression regulator)
VTRANTRCSVGFMLIPYLLVLALVIVVVRYWLKRQHRARLLSSEMSPEDWATVLRLVPIVAKLPSSLQTRLQGKALLFLDQIDIYGRNGLVVTRDMELSLAAQACLLIVNSTQWYDSLRTVLLYPGAFQSMQSQQDGYLVTQTKQVRLRESWHRGPVVLSWAHTLRGGEDPYDGHNLVLHEFAHQLDALSGSTDGVPVLMKGQGYADWEAAIVEGFSAHVENVKRGRSTVLDPYAATKYVEFFAVCIEVSFEQPQGLKDEYPDVYHQMSLLLGLDPLDWD